MRARKKRYLHYELVKSVFGTALLFAVLISVLLFVAELQRASEKNIGMLNQLLDTVESSAAVSAYSGNRQIGEDVLKGLLSNDIVQEARLTNDRGFELRLTRGTKAARQIEVSRSLQSPFGDEIIGHLVIVSDEQFNLAEARHGALYGALNSSLLIGLTAMIVLLVMRSSLSRPLMAVSNTLHAIKAGERERLEFLPRHENDELGQLVHDINGLLGTLQEKFEAERLLREEIQAVEHRLRNIFETTSAGIFQLDSEARLRTSNPTLNRVLRLSDIEPGRWTHQDFPNLVFAEPERLYNLMREADERGQPVALDLQLKGEGEVWVHCLLSRQTDSEGAALYEGVVYDITERRAAEKRARLEADYDSLTGLYRRQPAERKLVELLRTAPNRESAHVVLLLDLDCFKEINDTLGHAAGDAVLVEIARRLRSCVRAGDIVARLGGDEFLIVLVDWVPGERARAVAREIIVSILRPVCLRDGQWARVGVSIGIAAHDDQRRTVQELLEAADHAMYEAKRQGRNGFGMIRSDGNITVERVADDGMSGALPGVGPQGNLSR